jgi:hypothetical protein
MVPNVNLIINTQKPQYDNPKWDIKDYLPLDEIPTATLRSIVQDLFYSIEEGLICYSAGVKDALTVLEEGQAPVHVRSERVRKMLHAVLVEPIHWFSFIAARKDFLGAPGPEEDVEMVLIRSPRLGDIYWADDENGEWASAQEDFPTWDRRIVRRV